MNFFGFWMIFQKEQPPYGHVSLFSDIFFKLKEQSVNPETSGRVIDKEN